MNSLMVDVHFFSNFSRGHCGAFFGSGTRRGTGFRPAGERERRPLFLEPPRELLPRALLPRALLPPGPSLRPLLLPPGLKLVVLPPGFKLME